MDKRQIAVIAVVILVAGGIGFFAGSSHRGEKSMRQRGQFQQQMGGNFGRGQNGSGQGQTPGGQNGNPGMMQGGGPGSGNSAGGFQGGQGSGIGQGNGQMMGANLITGKITEKNDKTLTIELSDGTTKTVTISDSTAISKNVSGSDSDLNAGAQVTINPDNTTIGADSIVAKNIQIQTEK